MCRHKIHGRQIRRLGIDQPLSAPHPRHLPGGTGTGCSRTRSGRLPARCPARWVHRDANRGNPSSGCRQSGGRRCRIRPGRGGGASCSRFGDSRRIAVNGPAARWGGLRLARGRLPRLRPRSSEWRRRRCRLAVATRRFVLRRLGRCNGAGRPAVRCPAPSGAVRGQVARAVGCRQGSRLRCPTRPSPMWTNGEASCLRFIGNRSHRPPRHLAAPVEWAGDSPPTAASRVPDAPAHDHARAFRPEA